MFLLTIFFDLQGKKGLPSTEYVGAIDLNGCVIPCAVLDGKRLISQSGMQTAFGKSKTGRRGRVSKAVQIFEESEGRQLPNILRFDCFMPLINRELVDKFERNLFILWIRRVQIIK